MWNMVFVLFHSMITKIVEKCDTLLNKQSYECTMNLCSGRVYANRLTLSSGMLASPVWCFSSFSVVVLQDEVAVKLCCFDKEPNTPAEEQLRWKTLLMPPRSLLLLWVPTPLGPLLLQWLEELEVTANFTCLDSECSEILELLLLASEVAEAMAETKPPRPPSVAEDDIEATARRKVNSAWQLLCLLACVQLQGKPTNAKWRGRQPLYHDWFSWGKENGLTTKSTHLLWP